MKNFASLLFILLYFSYLALGQTILFSENFDEANNATSGTSAEGIAWTTTCDSCKDTGDYLKVSANKIKGKDTNGAAEFKTATIAIPVNTKYVTITMNHTSPGYAGTGNLESSDEVSGCSGKVEDALTSACANWDFLSYQADYGTTDSIYGILLGYKGSPGDGTLCQTINVSGKTSMTLTITMAMWASTEWMEIDNMKVIAYTSAEATANSIPSSSCPITQTCGFGLTAGTATCDSNTSATDTYQAEFNFTGGKTGETHTIKTSTGTIVKTNNPDSAASGKITVTGVSEGTNVTLTVNTSSCGDTSATINSPSCNPSCNISDLSATVVCDGENYDLKVKFKHEIANTDSVNIYVYDTTNIQNIDSMLYVSTTGDTQTVTIDSVATGDGTLGMSLRVIEVGSEQPSNPFISEIHYDDAGSDANEKVEISGLSGTNLAGWSVVLYNGNDGKQYKTINLTGIIDDEGSGEGALEFAKSGIQNGAPDGLALVNTSGAVIEFISYEGTFIATNGPAQGMTSTDIGVAESGSTQDTESLQKNSSGWQAPATNTMGILNTSLTISSSKVCADTIVFTEPNCCDSLSIDTMGDTTACDYFVLPEISGINLSGNEGYYTQTKGQGTKYSATDTLKLSDTIYLYDSISASCFTEDTFVLTLNSIFSFNYIPDTTVCDMYILPAIKGSNLSGNEGYYTQPNGKGTKYITGDTLTMSDTLYVYDSVSPNCMDIDSFVLTINASPSFDSLPDTSAYGMFTLPAIAGNNLSGNEGYYTQAYGKGIKYSVGDTLITSGKYYVFDSLASGCFALDSFELTIKNVECSISIASFSTTCNGSVYDIMVDFIHKNPTYSDSVNIYVNEETTTLSSLQNFKTTGDTQSNTLSAVAWGNGSDGLTLRVEEANNNSGSQFHTPFISEIHYDDAGSDANEKVEISGLSGTNLAGWSVVLYNGNDGKQYKTINLTGIIDDEGSGAGALEFAKSGIQNGAPDGLALVNASGVVIEFISYEGTFTATNGPAQGMTSTDIGVAESGSTQDTESLQKNSSGWQAPAANTMGILNSGLTISSSKVCADTIVFTEPNCCDSNSIMITNPGNREDSFDVTSLTIIDTSHDSETITFHNQIPLSALDYQHVLENNIIYKSQVIYVMAKEKDNDCFLVDSVSISIVNLDNNLPVAAVDSFDGFMNGSVSGNILRNDIDLDKEDLTVSIVTMPANGKVTMLPNGKFVYSANTNFIGFDYFAYQVCDLAGCDETLVYINIRGDEPIAWDDYYYGDINNEINGIVYLNDTSVDGTDLFFSLALEPQFGTVVFNTEGSFVYTPKSFFSGADSLRYMACNAANQCDTASVYFQVICDNFSELKWNIPKLLTPNADGQNDEWMIPSLYNLKDCYTSNEVIVFSRWEEKVMHRHNYGFNQQWWDGMSESRILEFRKSKQLPSGTYFYIIKFDDNRNNALTGFIHIQY